MSLSDVLSSAVTRKSYSVLTKYHSNKELLKEKGQLDYALYT